VIPVRALRAIQVFQQSVSCGCALLKLKLPSSQSVSVEATIRCVAEEMGDAERDWAVSCRSYISESING
jgi:hypothetical protein